MKSGREDEKERRCRVFDLGMIAMERRKKWTQKERGAKEGAWSTRWIGKKGRLHGHGTGAHSGERKNFKTVKKKKDVGKLHNQIRHMASSEFSGKRAEKSIKKERLALQQRGKRGFKRGWGNRGRGGKGEPSMVEKRCPWGQTVADQREECLWEERKEGIEATVKPLEPTLAKKRGENTGKTQYVKARV